MKMVNEKRLIYADSGKVVIEYMKKHIVADGSDFLQGYLAGIEGLANGLAELPGVKVTPEWIPVTERTPTESDGTVLVCHADIFPYNEKEPFVDAKHNRRVTVGSHSEHTNTWHCAMGGTLYDVTHWMPLPEPQNED